MTVDTINTNFSLLSTCLITDHVSLKCALLIPVLVHTLSQRYYYYLLAEYIVRECRVYFMPLLYLQFNKQLRKAEGQKTTPKVELHINVDGISIQEPKTKVLTTHCYLCN